MKSLEELEQGLEAVRRSAPDHGSVQMIVRRPSSGKRDSLAEGQLDPAEGLVGDDWAVRGSSRTPDGSSDPDKQVTLMNSRLIQLLAGSRDRWPLAGDQLYLDLDLSAGNLPPGTRLAIGGAILEITAKPHTGCGKFAERFGVEAAKWVNSKAGRALNLRGLNAKVVRSGTIQIGDVAHKVRG